MKRSSATCTSGQESPSTWVVDPDVEAIRVFRRSGEGFERPHELGAERGDTLTTPILPGFELALARVFEGS